MCTTTPKTPPVVEELPAFSIRDLVAEDLIFKTTENKPVEKKEKSVEGNVPSEGEPLIGFDEFINGTAPREDCAETVSSPHGINSLSFQSEFSPNGVKPFRIKRHYFQHTVEPAPFHDEITTPPDDIPPIKASPESHVKHSPPQKCPSDNDVKSPPKHHQTSALPASSAAAVTSTRRKNKKPKSQPATKRAFQSSCAMDMDLMKYGGAIDDLTAAFAGASFTASKDSGLGTWDEGMRRLENGAGSAHVENIELGTVSS